MSGDGLDWESQRVFLAVLRSGSLSGAARLLGIAQATARRRLEKLEQRVGMGLFTRTPNGLLATEAARQLSEHVEAMDAAARAFDRRASADAASVAGTVRITASELIGVEVLPTLLQGLNQRLPLLRLELCVSDPLQALSRQAADIAVRLQRPTEASVVTRRVGALRVGLYASAACIERYGTPASPTELAGFPLIGPDRRLADRQRLEQQGFAATEQDYILRSDNHLAQLAALRAGLGFAACPQQLAEKLGLVRVLEPELGFEVEVWIAMHQDLRQVNRVLTSFDALAQALEGFLR